MEQSQLNKSHYNVLDAIVRELGDFRLDLFDQDNRKLAIAMGNDVEYNTQKEGETLYVLPTFEDLSALGDAAESVYYSIVMSMLLTIVGDENFPISALKIVCQRASPKALVEAAREHPDFHFLAQRL